MAHPIRPATADQTRGGILRKPWQQALFMAGLFGGVALLALLLGGGS